MECQPVDSKKITKVFDAAQRKRSRKRREVDDANSPGTDESMVERIEKLLLDSPFIEEGFITSRSGTAVKNVAITGKIDVDEIPRGSDITSCPVPCASASLKDMSTFTALEDTHKHKRLEGENSPCATVANVDRQRSPDRGRSPDGYSRSRQRRRHSRRSTRDGVSLALKAGLVSTPRSISPQEEGDGVPDPIPQDQDSFIYTFLEEAIRRDKKRQRRARRHERHSADRGLSNTRDNDYEREDDRKRDRDRNYYDCDYEHERARDPDRDRHRHHHRHKDNVPSRDRETELNNMPTTTVNQAMIFETFAKICAQVNELDQRTKQPQPQPPPPPVPMVRSQSHKSLQCEVLAGRDSYDIDRQPVRLNSSRSKDLVLNKVRSQENCSNRGYSYDKLPIANDIDRCRQESTIHCCEKSSKYQSKVELTRSRTRHCDDRYRDYASTVPVIPTRSCIDPYRRVERENKEYRDYDRERDNRSRIYEEDKRKYCEQKASKSFDLHRECHDDERIRRTARSDPRERKYDERERKYDISDRRYDDSSKYYDEKPMEGRDRMANISSRDPRWRKNLDRFERNSVVSRDDDFIRDRFSERERDSGLSVADGDSTVSGRSNYMKVVKQQISDQREAMDKMMKLWKELMRCFKGMSQTPSPDKNVQETAANVKETATEQMRLWWECMRRYENVARDVGDTDARLMEEIKKQRSEMAEMATMWQECLQRYRDISNDFNNLKQQLNTTESPTRMPASSVLCAEGEGSMVPPQPYRVPPVYPVPQAAAPSLPPGYPAHSSPLRGRSSAPPWWWHDHPPPHDMRRRSSPDSRASRDRDKDRDREKEKTHRRRDRDEPRYKEKPSKPRAARSDHRHRKR